MMSTYVSPYSLWMLVAFWSMVATLIVSIIIMFVDKFDHFCALGSAIIVTLALTIVLGILDVNDRANHRPVVVSTETRTMLVVDYDPPKHFRVDLRDLGNGLQYNNVSVSKHCNGHRKIQKGVTTFYMRVDFMNDVHGDGRVFPKWRTDDINAALCY